MCVFVCVGISIFNTMLLSTFSWGPGAMAISRLMLTAVIGFNSVCKHRMPSESVTWNVLILCLGLGVTSLSEVTNCT